MSETNIAEVDPRHEVRDNFEQRQPYEFTHRVEQTTYPDRYEVVAEQFPPAEDSRLDRRIGRIRGPHGEFHQAAWLDQVVNSPLGGGLADLGYRSTFTPTEGVGAGRYEQRVPGLEKLAERPLLADGSLRYGIVDDDTVYSAEDFVRSLAADRVLITGEHDAAFHSPAWEWATDELKLGLVASAETIMAPHGEAPEDELARLKEARRAAAGEMMMYIDQFMNVSSSGLCQAMIQLAELPPMKPTDQPQEIHPIASALAGMLAPLNPSPRAISHFMIGLQARAKELAAV